MDRVILAPQPGPQSAFAACTADICFFGGQAGGGKSYSVALECARWYKVKDFGAVVFRRTTDQLVGAGSLWEECKAMFAPLGAAFKNSKGELEARWDESNAIVQFRHMEHEDDKLAWQGKNLALVCFDEVTHFTETQFWYLVSRMRTTCGIKPYIRATCNPDPDSFVRKLIDWWIGEDGFAIPERSGVIRWVIRVGDDLRWFDTKDEAQSYLDEIGDKDGQPKSFTFILSRLEDNPALTAKDPNYRGNLALMDAVTRARLLGGNWNARAEPGGVFRREWFAVKDKAPARSEISYSVRGWDLAASAPTKENPDPDWTYSTRMDVMRNGFIVVSDATCLRGPPGEVEAHIKHVVELDGPDVIQAFWINPGDSGKADAEAKKALCEKTLPNVRTRFVRQSLAKLEYVNPYAAFCDPATGVAPGASPGLRKVSIVRADWNAQWLSQHEKFPTKDVHDDAPDSGSRAYLEIHKQKSSGARKFLDAMGKA